MGYVVSIISLGIGITICHALKESIGIDKIGVIAEADKAVLTPKKYIFYNLHFGIQNLHIDSEMLKKHPCFENSSNQIISMIVMEGYSFESLLSTLPTKPQLVSGDKCMDDPGTCVNQIINKKTRKKRFVESIIIGLSNALFTFVSHKDLNGKIEKLREEINVQQNQISSWKKEAIITYYTVQKYAARNHEHLANLTCISDLRFTLTEYLFQVQSYYTKMRDLIVMALNNQISRDLIQLTDLMGIFLTKKELINTIYSRNPHLFYVLSNVFLSHYNTSTSTLTMTISIPQIEEDDVSMLYKVYNYGWEEDGIRHRYDLPQEYFTIYEDLNTLYVETSQALCRTVGTIQLCDTGSYIHSAKSSCLQSIMDNQTENANCEVLVSKLSIIDQVIPIRSGILVYGSKTIETGIMIKGHPTIQTKKHQKDFEVNFYKYKPHQFIKVGSSYYREKSNAEDIKLMTRAPLFHAKKFIDYKILGDEFTEDTIEHLEMKIQKMREDPITYYRSAYLPSPSSVDMITMIFIIISCSGLIVVGCFFIGKNVFSDHRMRGKPPSYRYPDERINLGSAL